MNWGSVVGISKDISDHLQIGDDLMTILVTQVNWGSVVGISKDISDHLQIGDDLMTVHNDQLVYLNCQDIALTLITGSRYGWFITVKQRKTT